MMTIGFTDLRVYLQDRDENKPCTNYGSFVFKVVPKLNYEVRKELQKKKKYYNKVVDDFRAMELKTANPEVVLKKYGAKNKKHIRDRIKELATDIELYEGRVKVEENLNNTFYRLKEKQYVEYGESIQLQHYESGFYLSGKKSLASEVDKSTVMVNLMTSGSFQSIWKVLPSVNHKKYGDTVRYSESVLLINEYNGLYLHSSGVIERKPYYKIPNSLKKIKDDEPDRKQYYQSYLDLKEVNCSFNKREWTIELYRKCNQDQKEYLKCGDTVRIKNTAINGYICSDIFTSADIKKTEEGMNLAYLRSYWGNESTEELDTGTYFVLEKGNTINEQISEKLGYGYIANYTLGKENTYKYRLRHLNTGRYLKVSEIKVMSKRKKRAEVSDRILGMSSIFDYGPVNEDETENKEFDDQTIFQFFSTSKEKNRNIKIDSYVKLRFFKMKMAGLVGTKIWLGVGDTETIKSTNQEKQQTENEYFIHIDQDLQGFEKYSVCFYASNKDENSFLIERVDNEIVFLLKTIHSSIGIIHWFVNLLKSGNRQVLSNWNEDIKQVLMYIKFVKSWVTGESCLIQNNIENTRIIIQKIARDLRIIDLIVDLIYYPYEIFPDEIKYDNISEKPMLFEIQKIAYEIIKNVFVNYRRNEFYAAQWIKLFIHQALNSDERNNIQADMTLAELFQSNKKLLDKYINESIIESLIDSKNKQKNVKLLSSLCVCRGEAVKSKQNKIIEQFIKRPKEFNEFFLKVDDITFRGKDSLIIEYKNKLMRKDEFIYLKNSIFLASRLCYDRNYKSIEQFTKIYQFFNLYPNFIKHPDMDYNLKSQFITLVQHLIFDKEPYRKNLYPIYIIDYPPKINNDRDLEYGSENHIKMMKQTLTVLLSGKDMKEDYDKILNSVMNIIHFMCCHSIYGKTEINTIIRTINERLFCLIFKGERGSINSDNYEIVSDVENTTSAWSVYLNSAIAFFNNINTLFIDDSFDLSLFSNDNTGNSFDSKYRSNQNKILMNVKTYHQSLIKKIDIFSYVLNARLNQAIVKFLTKCNTKFLQDDENYDVYKQAMIQCGVIPKPLLNSIKRQYIIMDRPTDYIYDQNFISLLDGKNVLHKSLSDFCKYIKLGDSVLSASHIDTKEYVNACETYLNANNLSGEKYDKFMLPITWIKELGSENDFFSSSNSEQDFVLNFLELLVKYISSSSFELYIKAYKYFIDILFSIEIFHDNLMTIQLVDNDDLKELHKKILIINKTLKIQYETILEIKNLDMFKLRIVSLTKIFFFLGNWCLLDDTEYDSKSNLKTIDRTGSFQVDKVFEELYSIGMLDNESDSHNVQEQLSMHLKNNTTQTDIDEILNSRKWKYYIHPKSFKINPEIQLMFLHLNVHENIMQYININLQDLESEYADLVNTLKQIAYRFLIMMCYKNSKILTHFQKYLPIIQKDMENSLVACQLWIEIVRSSQALLSEKSIQNHIYTVCKLISTYDEDLDIEKSIGIRMLNKLVYFRSETIKTNQNFIMDMLKQDKGLNLTPRILASYSEHKLDELPAYFGEDIADNINTKIERQKFVTIKSYIIYTQEYIKLIGTITAKDNFYTESHVKDTLSVNILLNLLESANGYIVLERKVIQMFIDSFLDLEQLEDNQMVDIVSISPLLKIILNTATTLVSRLNEEDFDQYVYYLDLIPGSARCSISMKEVCLKYLYEQVVSIAVLLLYHFKEKVQDSNEIKKLIDLVSELELPSYNKIFMLNYTIFCLFVKKYVNNVKDKIINYYEGNRLIVDNIDRYLDFIEPYEFMRNNYIMYKDSNYSSTSKIGKVDKYIKNMVNILQDNIIYQQVLIENTRNFTHFLNSYTLKYSTKCAFLENFVTIVINHHDKLDQKYVIRGMKFLRNFIECWNIKNFKQSLYWKTSDYEDVQAEIEECQKLLNDAGVTELCVLIICKYNDLDLINEVLLLALALLLGGNEDIQMRFYDLYYEKNYDQYITKIYDLLNYGFNKIRIQESCKNNSSYNQLQKTSSLLSNIPFIVDDYNIDEEQIDAQSFIQKDISNLDLEADNIHQMDGATIEINDYITKYISSQVDWREMIFRIMKFLQNLCENHNRKLQNFCREQISSNGEVSSKSKNFLSLLCQMFKVYLSFNNKEMIWFCIQVVDTLTEFVQGPCQANQKRIVEDKGLDTCRDVLYCLKNKYELESAGFITDEDYNFVSKLKYKTIILISSLCEGNKNDPDFPIYEEIPKSIEFDILVNRLVESYCNFYSKYYLKSDDNDHDNIEARNAFIVSDEAIESTSIVIKKDQMDDYYLQEGFNIAILIMNISDYNRSFKSMYQEVIKDNKVKKAYNFFKLNTSNIDVAMFGNVWRIYFPIHPYSHYLSNQSKDEFFNTVDRETPMSKLSGLVDESKFLMYEMKLQYEFNQLSIYPNQTVVKKLKDLLLFIAIVQNMMYLWLPKKKACTGSDDLEPCYEKLLPLNYLKSEIFCYQDQWCSTYENKGMWYLQVNKEWNKYFNWISTLLGMFQLIVSIIIFVVWYINNNDLIKFRYWQTFINKKKYECDKTLKFENFDKEKINAFYEKKIDMTNHNYYTGKTVLYLKGPESIEFVNPDEKSKYVYHSFFLTLTKYYHDCIAVLTNHTFIYYFVYIILSIMGTFFSPFFFIFHIYDIILRYKELMNILYAITQNCEMLTLTILLSIILIYIISLLEFAYYYNSMYFTGDVDENNRPFDFCNNIWTCLAYNVDYGIRGGGGHLVNMSINRNKYYERLGIDVFFIVIIVIVLMNIIFGIVIDTFVELYETNKTLVNDINDICFICELNRDNLEKKGISFDQHVSYDHSWESYLKYIMHLYEKDRAHYNGIELEIMKMIQDSDMGFFPRKKIFDIDMEDIDEEEGDKLDIEKLLEATKRIKNDIKKISDLMDSKIEGN